MQNPEPRHALICSLEGALLTTDLKAERILNNAKNALERTLSSELDLKQLKAKRADTGSDEFVIPVNEEVVAFLKKEKAAGRTLLLDTTEAVTELEHFLPFTNIFNGTVNSEDKTALPEQYDYIGHQKTLQSNWDNAITKYSAGPKPLVIDVARHFDTPVGSVKTYIKAIRAYQWLKNLLVFVPLITSQQLNDTLAIRNSIIMFFCFSAVASFGYIVNDLLDLQSDRAHHSKRTRPFASGLLSAKQGVLIAASLLALAFFGSLFLPPTCALVLLAYLVLTVTYSLYLKTKLMLDVVSLGGLFTLRVIGGAAAISSPLSFFLLSFSIFLFSSLGMVKRFAELHNLQSQNKVAARGRGYLVEDMAPVRIIGISLGYMSVFIMGLYINSPLVSQYYNNPKTLWLLFPLLTYWLGRLWILANRGEVNEDPLLFALKDSASILVAVISAVILVLAN